MRWSCMWVSCYILHSALSCYTAIDLSDTSACQLYSFYTPVKSPISAIDVILPFTPVFWLGTCRCPDSLGAWGDSEAELCVAGEPQPPVFGLCQCPTFNCRWANTCFVAHERTVGPRLKGSCFRFNWYNRTWCTGWVRLCGIGYDNVNSVSLCFLDFMSTLCVIWTWVLCLITCVVGLRNNCCLCFGRRCGICKGITVKIKLYNSAGNKAHEIVQEAALSRVNVTGSINLP